MIAPKRGYERTALAGCGKTPDRAACTALRQTQGVKPVILHSDRSRQFTSDEHQRFLKGHPLQSSMSRVGSCVDNAAAEGFFGLLKRERDNRRQSQTRTEARADVFDSIERFHNPRRTRRVEQREGEEAFIKPSVKKG